MKFWGAGRFGKPNCLGPELKGGYGRYLLHLAVRSTQHAPNNECSEESSMQTVKQIVCDTVNHLPEQATFDDAIYALYVRQKLEEGLRDLNEGRTYTQEEVELRLLGKSL